ncbi:MAG: preprotein translocase subunit SecE [Clostridiales bacterium]
MREVKGEMKKVTWPTKQQLVVYTAVVFIAVVFVAALIWAIDSFFSVAFRWLLKG